MLTSGAGNCLVLLQIYSLNFISSFLELTIQKTLLNKYFLINLKIFDYLL